MLQLIQVLLLFLLQPLALLYWQWRAGEASRVAWLLKSLIAIGWLLSLALGVAWLAVPWWLGWAFVGASSLLAARAAVGVRSRPWLDLRGWASRLRLSALAATAALVAALLVHVLAGRQPPDQPQVDLRFPMAEGVYAVANGGSRALLNPHLATLAPDPAFRAWRGQSHGVDIVKLNRWGLRADGFEPTDPARYAIYGDRVLSPCAGTVVQLENDRPQMPVPVRDPDRDRLAGNHVMLDCGGVEVLLAHLQAGSVAVAVGDEVASGDLLGRVGNTGNTTEPHLHVSAQRRLPGQPPVGGEPVPIRFDGVYPVRNRRFVTDSGR